MTLSILPPPPAGYFIVTEGKVRPGDLAWTPSAGTWSGPSKIDFDVLGREAASYYAIARPDASTRKAKDLVLKAYPDALAIKEVGTFAGGKVRYKVLLKPRGRKVVGYGQRESWAWADAARALQLK